MNENTWLLNHSNNITSQYGEDGIIQKILEIMPDKDNWCVEFGSWDGMQFSNTYSLITDKDYSAVLIEGSSKKFKDLLETFKGNDRAICMNSFVGFDTSNKLDTILSETDIPQNFDFLSIDIDGNDYHIWESVSKYKPKVVIIEFNPTIPNQVEFVQPKDMSLNLGSSILSIIKLGNLKGYELVSVTAINAIFVDKKYFDLFNIRDNSIAALRKDMSYITYLFSGYDGSVFIRGHCQNPWTRVPFRESKMQILPKWARKRFIENNVIRRYLGKQYRKLLKHIK